MSAGYSHMPDINQRVFQACPNDHFTPFGDIADEIL